MIRKGSSFAAHASGVVVWMLTSVQLLPCRVSDIKQKSYDDMEMGNLPAQTSVFIGRKAELAAVRALVSGSRLVTLAGAGGVGKTRLALEVTSGLLDRLEDGAWFVELAPLSDPGLVAVTVADVLGVRLESGRPVLETLAAAVGGRRMLIVLDIPST